MSSLLTWIFDERSSNLKGTLSTTCGYNVGGNSDEPSIPPKLIPAREASPLKEEDPVFTSELSWGIKVVEDVNSLGWNKAKTTPNNAANIEVLNINFLLE